VVLLAVVCQVVLLAVVCQVVLLAVACQVVHRAVVCQVVHRAVVCQVVHRADRPVGHQAVHRVAPRVVPKVVHLAVVPVAVVRPVVRPAAEFVASVARCLVQAVQVVTAAQVAAWRAPNVIQVPRVAPVAGADRTKAATAAWASSPAKAKPIEKHGLRKRLRNQSAILMECWPMSSARFPLPDVILKDLAAVPPAARAAVV
jgi:hypothetical protein